MSYTENICLHLTPNLSVAEINPYAQKILNLKKHDTFPEKLFEQDFEVKEIFTTPSRLMKKIKESPHNIFQIESKIQNIYIQWYVTAIFQDDMIEAFLLVGNNISADKITQKYEGLESIIKHLPGNVYWADLECRQMGCNENVLKMLGMRKEDYIGKTHEELAKIVGWKKGEEQFFKKDDIEVLTTGKPKYNVEEPPVMHKDGSIHYYITTRVPILNAENTIMGAAGISTDITELKATQAREKKAIKEAAEEKAKNTHSKHMQEILDLVPCYIFWKDINSVFLGCNQLFAAFAGLKLSKEIVGKTDYDLPWAKEESAQYQADDKSIMTINQPRLNIEETQTLANGFKRFLLTSKVPYHDKKGKVIGVIGVYQDITEHKLAQMALLKAKERTKKERKNKIVAKNHAAFEKLKAQSEEEFRRATTIFAGSIAHDLRNPLTGLRLMTDVFTYSLSFASADIKKLLILEKENQDARLFHLNKLDEFPNKIKQVMDEMNTFISVTLKSMHRIVSGTLRKEDFIVCNIEQCLEEVLAKYPFHAEQLKLVHVETLQNFNFLACPILFYRILFNLIANALQQIDKHKQGEIFITTSNKSENFNTLFFRDTAGNVNKKILKHLFEGYKTTKKKGTGVGLAFCKLTMQSFGGDITCHSENGDDIKFILTLPKLSETIN